ncbi:MAG: C40 family peptidase [Bacteroidota bacterium]
MILVSCAEKKKETSVDNSQTGPAEIELADTPNPIQKTIPYQGSTTIDTHGTTREDLLTFAKSMIGTPYLYASTDPNKGFDCSGFITYVFNHFDIAVPRSSIDFTNVQKEIPLQEALPGDLILFTGTDSSDRNVGHMGILVSAENNSYSFIHATSGKAYGVTITPLNDYYKGRFVKVLRVFPDDV